MVDILVPFLGGVLLFTKPGMFVKKDLDTEKAESKTAFIKKIGLGLMAVSVVLFLGKVMSGFGGR